MYVVKELIPIVNKLQLRTVLFWKLARFLSNGLADQCSMGLCSQKLSELELTVTRLECGTSTLKALWRSLDL